jgi:SMI1 / KNR4 family (SUKH-1)
LCALDDMFPGEFAANVSLARDDDATPWASDEQRRSKLAVFASDGDGSYFAFWLEPTTDVERAPVVFLAGDDPDETQVIANDIRDFLALLGLCLYSLGTIAAAAGPWAKEAMAERKEEPPSAVEKAFHSWLKQQAIKIPTAREAEAIVKRANQAHASFLDWLR